MLFLVNSLAGLILVPVAIVRLPSDYLLCAAAGAARDQHTGWARCVLLLVLKNMAGMVLLLAIFLGMLLLQFPEKHRAVRLFMMMSFVHRSINLLRSRWNQPPLQLP